MVLSFDKDNKNVGTMSERVFAGKHSPSVKQIVHDKIYDGCGWNLQNYIKQRPYY